MELDDVLFDRIHRYLDRQMTEAEQQAFEATIEADASLSQEVELQRQIKAGFQVMGYRQTLDGIHTELNQAGLLWQPTASSQPDQPVNELPTPQTATVVRQLNWIPYAVAASVLLVAGWLFYPSFDQSKEQVAHKPDRVLDSLPPSLTAQSSTSALPLPTVPPSEQQLLASQYDKLVTRYFTPSLRLNTPKPIDDERLGSVRTPETPAIQNDTTAIRTGIRLLQTGKARMAIQVLKPTTRVSLPDWQANARWFLALAYLKNHQPDLARQQLQMLTENNANLFTKDAQQLLQSLSVVR